MFRVLVGLIGAAGVAAAVAILLGGGTLYWMSVALVDDQGFLNSEPGEIHVDAHALVTGAAQIDISEEFPLRLGELATFRIQAKSLGPSEEIFIGVAPPEEIDRYLAASDVAELIGVTFDPLAIEVEIAAGQTAPRRPVQETFWHAAATGEGLQALSWDLTSGTYAVAVMNADASSGIHAELVVGGRVPVAQPTGVAMLIGGSVLLSLASILLAIAF
ncbi:MAG: hypothetical protein JSW65_04090 [Candidatus Bipolaricaulota bacterium]|nr:MAG: hypothetical protein JSW65_04090 [Candidatus Bipolaricaulota bacterium]